MSHESPDQILFKNVGTISTTSAIVQYDGPTFQCISLVLPASLNEVLVAVDSEICTLKSNVAANTGNIATNTGNIAQNTADIAQNTADIALLYNTDLTSQLTYDGVGYDGSACAELNVPNPKTLNNVLAALEIAVCAALPQIPEVPGPDSIATQTWEVLQDAFFDVTFSGISFTDNGNLVPTMTDGRSVINGFYVPTTTENISLVPNRDNYIYINEARNFVVKDVTIGNPAPLQGPEEMLVWKAEANGTGVVSTTDYRTKEMIDGILLVTNSVPNSKLIDSGVTDGVYSYPTLTVNSKGIITDILSNTLEASAVSYDNTASGLTAVEVQSAIDELASSLAGNNELSEILLNGNTTGGTDISVSTGDSVIFNNSTYTATIIEPTLTGDIVLTLPAQTGTLALLSDLEANDTFIEHADTPASYIGEAGKIVRVNAVPDGLEFADLTTADISEDPSYLYYTDERVDDRVAVLIQDGEGIAWTYDDGANTLTANTSGLSKDVSLTSITASDEDTTGVSISSTPIDQVIVTINGQSRTIGDGAKDKHCYFSDDGGTTAKSIANIASGDIIYWMGSLSGYELEADDYLEIIYRA